MRKSFKKPLIKVASVGMSIAMAATPMVAIADEDIDVTNDATEADGVTSDDTTPVTDEVKEESVTPVADEIRDVADEVEDLLPEEDEKAEKAELEEGSDKIKLEPAGEASPSTNPEADNKEELNDVKAQKEFVPISDAEIKLPKEETVSIKISDEKLDEMLDKLIESYNLPEDVDKEVIKNGIIEKIKFLSQNVANGSEEDYLNIANESLKHLAGDEDSTEGGDVNSVELANDASKQAAGDAKESEEKAAKSANSADASAQKAAGTGLNDDINAAQKEFEEATADYNEAVEKANKAEEAYNIAKGKLEDLLKANGLDNLSEKEFEELISKFQKLVSGEITINEVSVGNDYFNMLAQGDTWNSITSMTLALVKAQSALEGAQHDQKAAQAYIDTIKSNPYVRMGILRDEIAKIQDKDSDEYKAKVEEFLTCAYRTSKSIYSVDLKMELITKDDKGNDLKPEEYYVLVSYTENDEKVTDTINYSIKEDGSFVIVAKDIETIVITPAVEGKDAVYEYRNKDGQALDENSAKAVVQDPNNSDVKVVVSKESEGTVVGGLASNQKVVDGTKKAPTYTIENTTETTISKTDKKQFTNVNNAKKALEEAIANKADNQTVELNIKYDGLLFDIDKTVNSINGFEKMMTWIYNKFGSNLGLQYTVTTTTVTPVVKVTETVKADIDQTDNKGGYTSDYIWPTVKKLQIKESSKSKAESQAIAAKAAWESNGEGYYAEYKLESITGKVLGMEIPLYRYKITYYQTTRLTDQTVSTKVYYGTSYTNTLVSEAVAPVEAVTQTTYKDGTEKIFSSEEGTKARKEIDTYYGYYNDAVEVSSDAKVTAAKEHRDSVYTVATDVVNAIKNILSIKVEKEYTNNNLVTIADILNKTKGNLEIAIQKKLANDEAEKNAQNQETTDENATTGETTTTGGGDDSSSSGGTTSTAGVSTTLTAAQPVQIPEAPTPLAGPQAQTRNTRRNGVAGVRTANANDANANGGAEAGADAADVNKDTVKEDEIIDMIQIDDEDVAKTGQAKDESEGLGAWLWGLIVALLAAAGITTYEVAKNKKKPTIKK